MAAPHKAMDTRWTYVIINNTSMHIKQNNEPVYGGFFSKEIAGAVVRYQDSKESYDNKVYIKITQFVDP